MKKRVPAMLLSIMMVITLSACGESVSREEYDTAIADKESLQDELDKLKEEYENMKEKVAPYLALSTAEAEAATAKAEQEKKDAEDQLAAQKAAEAEAARVAAEAAAAQKAAEEKKGYETGITYNQLARTPDDYKGKKVKFSGKVIQVMEGDGKVDVRIAVGKSYDTIIYGAYNSNIVSSRVLEDDIVTVYGTSAGLVTYQSTMGGNITIPSIVIDKIDQ